MPLSLAIAINREHSTQRLRVKVKASNHAFMTIIVVPIFNILLVRLYQGASWDCAGTRAHPEQGIEYFAYCWLGEVGVKNFRPNVTIAVQLVVRC
jgi:hypothetical protein